MVRPCRLRAHDRPRRPPGAHQDPAPDPAPEVAPPGVLQLRGARSTGEVDAGPEAHAVRVAEVLGTGGLVDPAQGGDGLRPRLPDGRTGGREAHPPAGPEGRHAPRPGGPGPDLHRGGEVRCRAEGGRATGAASRLVRASGEASVRADEDGGSLVPVDDHPARRHLDGAHVLLTGATGFLGQATLEKLLSSYPTTRVTLLIRPRGSQPGASRLPGLIRKPVFERWRERVGPAEVERAVAERVSVLDGELDAATNVTFPSDLDVVIHGASTVSFDPPIDEAFQTNVGGVANLYGALNRIGADPHVVHISTAYVAGVRKGVVNEAPLTHDVDWSVEEAAASA